MPVSTFHAVRLQVTCNAHLALYVGSGDPNVTSALLVEHVLKAKTAPARELSSVAIIAWGPLYLDRSSGSIVTMTFIFLKLFGSCPAFPWVRSL